MRLWSLHPNYLDAKGLVALWREALLAKHVLAGTTVGYRNHPQLTRFRKAARPQDAINQYLTTIYQTATEREYSFDRSKINWDFEPTTLTVTTGQVNYETGHLLKKLMVRDSARIEKLRLTHHLQAHPLFEVVDGPIEPWEIPR